MDLVGGEPEEEEVLRPNCIAYLDIGTIEGADGESTVHRKLHVARSGGFLTGRRYLLGEVGARIDELGRLDVVVRDEHDFQRAPGVRIGIDDFPHRVDQLDDELGHRVAGCSLAAEDEGSRRGHQVGVFLELPVEVHDVEHRQMLTLVLVNTLDLNVEHRVEIRLDLHELQSLLRSNPLTCGLDGPPLRLKIAVIREPLQPAQLVQIGYPRLADVVGDQLRELRVGECHETAGRHSIGLVVEFSGVELVEVAHDAGLQQVGVEGGDSIDGEAADGGEVGHTHGAAATVIDQGHPLLPPVVVREAFTYFIHEAAIDLVDDFQVTRQQSPEHRQRPGLEGLRKQGVIRVRKRFGGDPPSVLPAHRVLVEQEPHQLGYGERRMGVVQLDGKSFMQILGPPSAQLVQPQQILQGARHQEILLLEPQLFALGGFVVGVQHLGECLRGHLVLDRAVVVTDIEALEVESFGCLRGPEAQHVHVVDLVAGNGGGIGDPLDHGSGTPANSVVTFFILIRFGMTAEAHWIVVFRPSNFPGVAMVQPFVGVLDLPAVVDPLLKDAELVSQAVTDRGDLQSGQRVHEARGQTTQSAIAEAWLAFFLDELVEVLPE